MTGKSVRRWRWVHEWSSLACTVFLLILCCTGLPLIFGDEIEGSRNVVAAPATASLDRIVARARVAPAFVRVAQDEGVIYLGRVGGGRPLLFDGHTGFPKSGGRPKRPGIIGLLLAMHGELFAGLPGRLFVAFIGATALLSVVSGVAIYAPFAGLRPFGDIRSGRRRRSAWLDRHNIIGVTSAMWLVVVTATGFMNAIERPLFNIWRSAVSRSVPHVRQQGRDIGPDQALATARLAAPDMTFETVIFPGHAPGIAGYYLVWGTGTTSITRRLTTPVAVDATTGRPAGGSTLPMPWYLRFLDLSRPLHFGDYGGLPLKIIWALLDLVTIVVLGSGLYLWIGKRKRAPLVHAAIR